MTTWAGFFCKNNSLNPLKFSLAKETDKQNKFFKTSILPNCQVANGIFSLEIKVISFKN